MLQAPAIEIQPDHAVCTSPRFDRAQPLAVIQPSIFCAPERSVTQPPLFLVACALAKDACRQRAVLLTNLLA